MQVINYIVFIFNYLCVGIVVLVSPREEEGLAWDKLTDCKNCMNNILAHAV